jgi:hypothetical protein
MRVLTVLALVLVLATSVYGLEKKAFQMREDFGTEPLYDCALNYYYYIPCPTYSWFWSYYGWDPGAVVGEWFQVGDQSMGGFALCDPYMAHTVQQFRVLDFAGYGSLYPGLFTVQFSIWCADESGCPVPGPGGCPLWQSGPTELCIGGWNYVVPAEPVCVTYCGTGNPPAYPKFLITAQHIGTNCAYPQWGLDNIGSPMGLACAMHDTGCLAALYPRPTVSHYSTIHTGFYGVNFAYCPPQWFLDGGDTVGNVYGFIELAWRVYLVNSGPTATEPSTWGNIKAMYR